MANKINLGVIGLSDGNGHPYSWSAIFNGFNREKPCPFPVIIEYLSKEKYPDNFLSEYANVTHIWTQSKNISKKIAAFAKIPFVVENLQEMSEKVDAVLLARDDAENHFELAKIFLEKKIPIFIDKPLAYSVRESMRILNYKKNTLIYTCSSIKFAKEFNFKFSKNQYNYVDAIVMKGWKKYAIHIIEPLINMFPERGNLIEVKVVKVNDNVKNVFVFWQYLTVCFKTMGNNKTPIKFTLFGEKNYKELIFEDTFYAFKSSLKYFIDLIKDEQKKIPIKDTLEIIEIIEKGS